jgi:hypothetical protein
MEPTSEVISFHSMKLGGVSVDFGISAVILHRSRPRILG